MQNAEGEKRTEREQQPVVVQNRDIPILADIAPLWQAIRALEIQRARERESLYNITQHLTGMPPGGGLPKGLDSAFARLSEIEEEHEAKCLEYVRIQKAAMKILNGIHSLTMRAFVIMRYMMDRPDTEIREELNMSRRGFERAKRAVEEAPCMAAVVWHERYIIAPKGDKAT